MKPTEIKEVKEYYWGSIVSVLDGNKPEKIITAKACYFASAVLLISMVFFGLGVIIGRIL